MKKYKMTLTGGIFTLRRAFCGTQEGCTKCPLCAKNNSANIDCPDFIALYTDEAAKIMNAELIEENKKDE